MTFLQSPKAAPIKDVAAIAALVCITVAMTWPLAPRVAVSLPNSDDAYFSVWRLAWIAHQLVTAPSALFDTNVFYPATDTLAYSDAMLLLGLAGAPFIWLGIAPWTVHNLLLGAAFAASAGAMYLLALRLTGDRAAAFLAGIIFGFAPYRFGHIGHLELQWVAWMPLSLLLLARLFTQPRPGPALALGAAVAAQALCSVYYGVFLSLYLGAAWCALMWVSRQRWRVAKASTWVLLPLVLVASVYARPYARSREANGPRTAAEVERFSAVPSDYLRVPPVNALRGDDHDPRLSPDERSLFPGTFALVFALSALWPPVRRRTAVCLLLGMIAFDVSLGSNGLSFPVLRRVAPMVGSLRAPSRFAILVLLSVSMLAAIGAARCNRALGGRASVLIVLASVLLLGEYWSAPLRLMPAPVATAVDRWLAQQRADTVIIHFPVPKTSALWLHETSYQVRSIHHWRRLVNGYSGFLPAVYERTLDLMESFPDAVSVDRLRLLSVDFVLVNREFLTDAQYSRMASALLGSADFGPPRVFGTGTLEVAVFPLLDSPRHGRADGSGAPLGER